MNSISVPSSSGKSLQPAYELGVKVARIKFQSPLHRGNHFNHRVARKAPARRGDFSPLFIGEITSTGGEIHPRLIVRQDFSPLFIGEITSTTPIQLDALRLLLFQSPLHRGNHFNRISNSTTGRRFPDFSPLFIGEITSTAG